MSWLFSQVLVEEYLGDISLDGEQSVQSNGNPTQLAYCAPDKMTVFSRLSRFGMTYKPLTENLGEELLTLYREDFLVQTSALQEEEQDLMENNPQCGITWRGWLAKFDPDSYSWKTAQCSFIEESGESLETFPVSGMTQNGLLWERTMLEHRTSETEHGLWRTPDTGGGGRQMQLTQGKDRRASGHLIKVRLLDQVNNPRLWPTPARRDYKGANGFETSKKKMEEGLRAHMGQLPNAVQHMEQAPIGGSLNPTWVEWLMGWPLGWTDLKPLETDKCLYMQQQHGEY